MRFSWAIGVFVVIVGSGCGGRGEPEVPSAPPGVTVEVAAPGLSPEEVEQLAILPIERAMSGASDVVSMSAISTAGRAELTLVVARDADLWRIRSMVSERLAQVTLPDDTQAWLAPPAGDADELYLLRSDRASPAELGALMDYTVKHRLLQVDGVVDVTTCGGAVTTVEIALDPERLRAHDISAADVIAAMSEATASNAAGGIVHGAAGDYIVHGAGMVMEDFGDVRIAARADRGAVSIRDVAEVGRRAAPSPCQALLADGTSSLTARVRYSSSARRTQIASAVEELQRALPPGVVLEPFAAAGTAATLHFRVSTMLADDVDAVPGVAQVVARVAGTGDGVERAVALVGYEPRVGDRWPGEIDVVVALAPGPSAATTAAGVAKLLGELPGVTIRRPETPASQRLRLELVGLDRASLATTAERVRQVVVDVAGVEAAVTIGSALAPRRSIALDRDRMDALGVAARDVMDAFRIATEGRPVGELVEGARRFPVELRWAGLGRDPEELRRMPLRASDGSWIALGQVVSLGVDTSLVALLRTDGSPSMEVWIELDPKRRAAIEREIRRRVAEVDLAPDQRLTLR